MIGFYIKQLVIKGKGLRDAVLYFEKGANIITGASDTGKSYAFSAISYGLGGTEPPKEIVEGNGYDEIYVEISDYSENKYTLYRIIGQNKVTVKQCAFKYFETLKVEFKRYSTTGPVDKEDHLSGFLLSLCNLSGKQLLYNRTKGVTHKLSFDSLRKLTFIDEERIIKTASPFYFSSQFINQTKGQSLLSLVMTGEDYSDIKEKEDSNLKETRIKGKLEFIAYQIAQLATEKDEIADSLKDISTDDRIRYINLDNELQENLKEAKELTKKKNWVALQQKQLREELIYNLDLAHRFGILEKQYLTDIERLDFILEGSVLSAQLGDTICPICSSSLDENHMMHLHEKEDFRNAAVEELRKNRIKLEGLKETIITINEEEIAIRQKASTMENEMQKVETQLETNFSPKIQSLKNSLQNLLNIEKSLNGISFIDKQISALHKEKDRLEQLLLQSDKAEETTILSYSLLSELCEAIQARLLKWNYEPHVKVDFDSNYRVFDIVISGKSRKSYGKGKRSISYAACLIGLLDYCKSKSSGFSNLIIMDSPLTTFEEKRKSSDDESEILSQQVLRSFFLNFGDLPDNSQVIIFDNKQPDVATYQLIKNKVTITTFTGTEEGRSGFFPR